MPSNTEILASNLNRQVNLEAYDYTKGSAGGLTPVLIETLVNVWAQVDQLSGGDVINQGQDKNFAGYKIILRYRPELNEKWIIFYEGQRMKIKQMQVDNTAYKRYWIIYCSTSIQQQDWS